MTVTDANGQTYRVPRSALQSAGAQARNTAGQRRRHHRPGPARTTGPDAALPADGPQATLPGDVEARAIIKSLGPQWRMMYDYAGRLRGAVRQRDIRPDRPGRRPQGRLGAVLLERVQLRGPQGRHRASRRHHPPLGPADCRPGGQARRALTVAGAAEATPETVTLAGVRTAVALLARHRAPEVPREDVLEGHDPGDILAAMESIAGGLLAGAWPDDGGAGVLERVGLAVARQGTEWASGE